MVRSPAGGSPREGFGRRSHFWGPPFHPARSILAAALFGLSCLALPVPSDPDAFLSTWHLAGAWCSFGYFLLGVDAWGALFARAAGDSRPNAATRLPLGAAGACLVVALTGALGLLGPGRSGLYLLLLAIGIAGEGLLPRTVAAPRTWAPRLSGWAPTVLLAAAFALGLLQAATPQLAYPDPFNTYLVGPRLWYLEGAIRLDPRVPIGLLASGWSYLFVWAHELIGGEGSRGALEAVVFGQLIHLVIGLGGSLLILRGILRKLALDEPWLALAVAAGASSGFLAWSAPLAKNDWGAVFFTLAAIDRLLDARRENFRSPSVLVLAGGFAALAFCSKYTAAFALLPALALSGPRRARPWGWLAAGAWAMGGPFLLRNAYWTGNPLFPGLDGVFHTEWLAPTLRRVFGHLQGAADAIPWRDAWLLRLRAMIHGDPLGLAALALALPTLAARRGPTIGFAGVSAYLAFLATISAPRTVDDGTLSLRLLGPGIVLAGAFLIVQLRGLLPEGRPRITSAAFIAAFLLLGWTMVANRPWPLREALQDVQNPAFAMLNRFPGASAKAWLRMNAAPSELIVTTGDDRLYFNLHQRISSVTEQPQLDAAALDPAGVREHLRRLVGAGARYILDTRHPTEAYWSNFSYEVSRAVLEAPWAILFQGRDSRVIDPRRLLEDLEQGCALVSAPADPRMDLI